MNKHQPWDLKQMQSLPLEVKEWWYLSNIPHATKVFNNLFKEIPDIPKCDFCGEPIQDGFCYRINGEAVCKHCLDRHFKEEVIPYE